MKVIVVLLRTLGDIRIGVTLDGGVSRGRGLSSGMALDVTDVSLYPRASCLSSARSFPGK